MSTKARVISSTSGPMLGAEKRGRGEIERQLLHRRIEQHRAGLRLPLRHPRRDAGIERGEIGFHRPGLEGDRQRAAVQPMLVEIEQHQPARKQPAQDRAPAMGRGEQFALVEQHEFIGFGPEHADAGLAEHPAAIDQAVFRRHPLDLALGVGEYRQRPADHRPALVAGNVRQQIALWRGEGRSREKPHFASTWQLLRRFGRTISHLGPRPRCRGRYAFRFAASICKSGAFTVGIATRPGPVRGSAAAAFSFSMILAITAWPARSNIARFSITNCCDWRSARI